MYKRTHANFGPGEQRKREYDWSANPTIDNRPQTFSFGFGEQRLQNGAAKAVHAERIEESFPKTVIVKKTVEDVKGVTTDMLGTVKNLGQGQAPRDKEFTYGISNNVKDWNAAKCLMGEPTLNELVPDYDLGKSRKPNCTN